MIIIWTTKVEVIFIFAALQGHFLTLNCVNLPEQAIIWRGGLTCTDLLAQTG